MTLVEYWDGSSWKFINTVQGPPGPPGPLGPPTPPSGPAGGDLKFTYPNPGIDRERIGGILETARIFGSGSGTRAIVNGQNFAADNAGAVPLRLSITPSVTCWWEVEAGCSYLYKTDAAYHMGAVQIVLSPNDLDGQSSFGGWEHQHLNVQTYCFKSFIAGYRLAANQSYTATLTFSQLTTGGTWQQSNHSGHLWMGAKAWAL